MADLPVQPVQNFGQLLSAYGEGLANQENATTNNLNSQVNARQLPSEIAARQAGIGQTQATTGLINQQTTAADIANQRAALVLQLTKNALHNYAESSDAAAAPQAGADNEGGSDTGPASTSSKSGANADSRFRPDDESAAHFDQVVSDKFRVNPAFTPQEQAQFNAAIPLAISGDHGMLDAVKQAHDLRVQNQTANSQNQAQQAFDKMYAVNTAPDGSAFAALKGAFPQAADHLATIHGLDPDHPEKWTEKDNADLDTNARKYSEMLHNSLFQYTGDKLEDKNGVTVDSRTGKRPIGSQAQGLSNEQWAAKYKEATSLDEIPDPNGGPNLKLAHWRALGFPSANAYVRNAASGGGANTAAGAPESASGPPNAGGRTVGAKTQPVTGAGAGTTAVASQPGNAPPTTGNLTQDPILRKMLSDPTYNAPAPKPIPAGAFAGQSKQDTINQEARTKLLDDMSSLTTSSSQGLQYANAAKAILNSKGAPVTGLYAPIAAQISRVFPGGVNAANYQEVTKYLGNLSVQNFKQNFGARPANAEFQIQMNELNPNVKMQDSAINDLLDTNIRNMQYGIDTGQRAKSYLAAGKDPLQFAQANQQYFPREKIVNRESLGETTSTGKGGSNSSSLTTPVSVKSRADVDKLPAGQHFKTPDGRILIAPGAKSKSTAQLGTQVPTINANGTAGY